MVLGDDPSCPSEQAPKVWVRTELESADFGDKRLNVRLLKIVEKFLTKPQASIPEAMGAWADTKGTYRFINNAKVTPEKILEPHRQKTLRRMEEQPVILAVQDTTDLNFTAHPATQGLGTIGSSVNFRGMLVHTTLAFTPERVPLGIIAQHSWVRPEEELGKSASRKGRSLEQKESIKWLNSLEAAESLQQQISDVKVISVGDREADIFDLATRARKTKCGVLFRASENRRVEHEERYLWPFLEAQPVAAALEMTLPVKKTKKKRSATVELRFARVRIFAPKERRDKEAPVELDAVYVKEINPPPGTPPLSWKLLTTLSVTTVEEALTIVNYYSVRWGIEVFHRILKTGCRIEERQLQTADGLRACLALDSLVAWWILFLTTFGRRAPDLPCDVVFEEYEWKALYCFFHKTRRPPQTPPSLNEAIGMIARIGGFLCRKRDGDPGPTVLWRGLQELSTICSAWFAFGPERVST